MAYLLLLHVLLFLFSSQSHAKVPTYTARINCTSTSYTLFTVTPPVSTYSLPTFITVFEATSYIDRPTPITEYAEKYSTLSIRFVNTITESVYLPQETLTTTICKPTATPSDYPAFTTTLCTSTYTSTVTETYTKPIKYKLIISETITVSSSHTLRVYNSTSTTYSSITYPGFVTSVNAVVTSTLKETHYGHTTTIEKGPHATPSQFKLKSEFSKTSGNHKPDTYVYNFIKFPIYDQPHNTAWNWDGNITNAAIIALHNGSLFDPSLNASCLYYEANDPNYYEADGFVGVTCLSIADQQAGAYSFEDYANFTTCSIDCFGYLVCAEENYRDWYSYDLDDVFFNSEDYVNSIVLGEPQDDYFTPSMDRMKLKVVPV